MPTLRVKLFELPEHSHNILAMEELNKLSHVSVTEVVCPPGKEEHYLMPFIQSDRGTYFGIENIRAFVAIQIEDAQASLA